MLKFLALAICVCMVSCKDEVCKDLSANKLFADAKNPHIYHQCSYGKEVGTVKCMGDEVFDESQQTCVQPVIVDKECPADGGMFDYPGNPHKFIVCFNGHAFMFECPGNTVWVESDKKCGPNVDGKTWAPAF